MTKLAFWDDGYVIEIDGLRKDPLYYYMRDGGWGNGICRASGQLGQNA
jgi:hypothetical protein